MFGSKRKAQQKEQQAREEQQQKQQELQSKWQQLKEAVLQDDADRINNVSESLSGLKRQPGYYDLCVVAIENGKSNALKALLKNGNGFDFTKDSTRQDKELAKQLVEKACASSMPDTLLTVLSEANEYTYESSKLESKAFLSKETSDETIRASLEADSSLFDVYIKNIGLHSTQKLRFILTFVSTARNPQPTLDTALIETAGMGDVEKTRLLLDRRADPNYAGGQALLRAVESGQKAVAEVLLPLMKPDICRDVVIQLEGKPVPDKSIISIIENTTQEATPTYARRDSETLVKTQLLPGDLTLMTVFNFISGQEQTIVMPHEKDRPPGISAPVEMTEAVSASMRKKFDALGGEEKPAAPRPATALRLR